MYHAARSPATQLLNLSAPMLMMVSMVIAPSVHAQATSPPPSPSNWADMPAQQLVQKLFADEAWIWQADTMLIEYDFIKNL